MPIAIYPVFHRLHPDAGVADYLAAYRNLPFLPNGPPWFLWLLLAMSLAAAAVYASRAARARRVWRASAADARRRPQALPAALAGRRGAAPICR